MSLVDIDGLGELTVVERDGNSVVVFDRNGDAIVTFHELSGDYTNQPAWEAFIQGLTVMYPQISVFNESQGRYHVSMGQRWIEAEGRYETGKQASPIFKP
jgi:hypothetical protein